MLVLSDLHIDACDNFGTFQWNEDDFISHLETLRNIYAIDKVIFNGDVFELVKYRYEDIRKANPSLMRYFNTNDFVFIRGNHDIVTETLKYELVKEDQESIKNSYPIRFAI